MCLFVFSVLVWVHFYLPKSDGSPCTSFWPTCQSCLRTFPTLLQFVSANWTQFRSGMQKVKWMGEGAVEGEGGEAGAMHGAGCAAAHVCRLRCQLTVHSIEGGGPASLFFPCNRHLPTSNSSNSPTSNSSNPLTTWIFYQNPPTPAHLIGSVRELGGKKQVFSLPSKIWQFFVFFVESIW